MSLSSTPYSSKAGPRLGKPARGVSIIGVGITPYGSVLEHPALKDLSEKELAAWAAQEAIADAGISAKDIESLCFAQAFSQSSYIQTGANMYMLDWLGMRGKASNWHEESDCSSYGALNEAFMTIASGKHDIVLVCGSDTDLSYTRGDVPPHIRFPMETYQPPQTEGPDSAYYTQIDHAYSRWNGTFLSGLDECAILYMKKFGLSRAQMADVLDALLVSMRHNAAHNPLAKNQKELCVEAAENGFASAEDYLRSSQNPFVSPLHRKVHMMSPADGGGALVLCASDIAKKYCSKPVEIVNIAIGSMDCRHPRYLTRLKESLFQQVLDAARIQGEALDLMYSSDYTIGQILQDSELAGYVPEGEAWRYALDGQFSFDGSKPYNTHGGTTGFGHVSGAQVFEQTVEAVRQMRGQCGGRQVNTLPKTAMISGLSRTQEGAALILRSQM